MKKWDVVLITFPFTDLQSQKVRPAVVISPDALHQKGDDALFIMITSSTDRQTDFDVFIPTNHQEYGRTGLMKESVVRVSKIMILNKTLVKRTMGHIGVQLSLNVEAKLRDLLQLPPYQPPLGT